MGQRVRREAEVELPSQPLCICILQWPKSRRTGPQPGRSNRWSGERPRPTPLPSARDSELIAALFIAGRAAILVSRGTFRCKGRSDQSRYGDRRSVFVDTAADLDGPPHLRRNDLRVFVGYVHSNSRTIPLNSTVLLYSDLISCAISRENCRGHVCLKSCAKITQFPVISYVLELRCPNL